MKKKWLGLMGLSLVLVMQLAMPAAVQAAKPQTFFGSGSAWINYMPVPIILGPRTLLFAGEVVEGIIDDSDLPGMTGAELYSVHTSIVKVNWATGEVKGVMTGTFTLTALDGSVLEGTMQARQSGNLFGDISSEGSWIATTRTGVFADVLPHGTWESTFDVYGRGTFSWDGRVR